MAKKKTEEKEVEKPVGPVIVSSPTLHGRVVQLVRGDKEVSGVLLSPDGKTTENLTFKWTDDAGKSCVSVVTGEEIEQLING